MSAVVLPLAPVRVVRVFWDFDGYRIVLSTKGRKGRRFGLYDNLDTARRAAERIRRVECVPTPPIVEPREVIEEAD